MYNEMVKNAYEEILGFDKIANVRDLTDEAIAERLKMQESLTKGGYKEAVRTGLTTGGIMSSINVANNLTKGRKSPKVLLGSLGYLAGGVGGALALQKINESYKNKLKAEQNRRQSQAAAEKAAAYYDEAQYVKEAAEADYAEACAYEDAAIQILDELGYLD